MANEITDAMLEEFSVTGSYDESPGLLEEEYDGMLDEVLIYFAEPEKDDPARWRRLIKAFSEDRSTSALEASDDPLCFVSFPCTCPFFRSIRTISPRRFSAGRSVRPSLTG
jgi:hypothetical protein